MTWYSITTFFVGTRRFVILSCSDLKTVVRLSNGNSTESELSFYVKMWKFNDKTHEKQIVSICKDLLLYLCYCIKGSALVKILWKFIESYEDTIFMC